VQEEDNDDAAGTDESAEPQQTSQGLDTTTSTGGAPHVVGASLSINVTSSAAFDGRRGAPHADAELDAASQAASPNAAPGEAAHPPALRQLLRLAAAIGRDDTTAFVSFTSLFLAFYAGVDPVSAWVRDKAEWIGPRLDDIVRRWRVRAPAVAGLGEGRVREAAAGKAEDLPTNYQISASAQEMLDAAAALAKRVGAERELGVHHVLAAYLYAVPAVHLHDLDAWKLEREAWATRFLCYITAADLQRAQRWRLVHDHHFPRPMSASATTALRWATLRAGKRATLDSSHLLEGIVLEGLTDKFKDTSASQLVRMLGPGVDQLGLEAATSAKLPEAELPFDPELLPVVDRARLLATATRTPRSPDGARLPAINVRHLIAALLSDPRSRGPGRLGAFALVRRTGRTEAGVLALFRQWLQTIGPGNDDRDRWRALFDELREPIVAGYHNDEAHGEDRLNISKDVRGLASVLASVDVTPPLSVGLFGDWGSGKSFFMGKLRERIQRLADAAKAQPNARSAFCGQRGAVVQIDFNAWHYMDADLWSSLAVRVFDALSAELKGAFAEACRTQLDSLKEREQALTKEMAAVTASATAIDGLLEKQREARATREVRLIELVRRLAEEQARKIQEDPAVAKVTAELRLEGTNIKRELQAAQRDLKYVGGRAELWWRTLRSPARVITLALVLGVPAMLAALIAIYGNAGGTIVAALATYTVTLAGLFARVRGFVGRVAGPIDAAIEQVAKIEQAVRDQKTPAELELEAERDGASARIVELEREQLTVAKRKTELEAELKALQSADTKTLREFILERAAAQDYRKNLGVISAIHKDFKQLADFLAPSTAAPNVERIVLYIDDLDRCPPRRVVEVLQAIHIILSLPLFVVVVGVDSRWLLDSLSAFYREQFPKDAVPLDAARPQQYLEKIFQVPFTLTPMSDNGYSQLVGSMLAVDNAEPATVTPVVADSTGAAMVASPRPMAAAASPPTYRAAAATSERIDLSPRSLQLEPEELEHLQSLGRLVLTPRAAKRLVNLYRIVRASLNDDDLTELIEGRYRLVQICLGLVIGHPTFGADLFTYVLANDASSAEDLRRWCRDRRADAQRSRSASGLRDLSALDALDAHLAEFHDWAAVTATVRSVARFSFETGRILALYPPAAAPPESR
jgi:KAP family P-loop domain